VNKASSVMKTSNTKRWNQLFSHRYKPTRQHETKNLTRP